MANRLINRFFSSGKIAVCSNGAVACWHPRTDIPFEHTRPIDLTLEKPVLQRKGIAGKQGPNNAELKEIFYTDKNEWFTRTREDRLRSVSAPLPKKH